MTSRNIYAALTPDVSTFNLSGLHGRTDSLSSIPPDSPVVLAKMHDVKANVIARWRRAVEIWNANTGLLLVMASQILFAIQNVAVKKLNGLDKPVPTLQLIFVRMSITWICSVLYMTIMKVEHPFLGPPGVRFLLLLRGFAGFFGLFGSYYSLKYLSLSDSTVLQFLAPMCTGIAGWLVLKEEYTRKQAMASLTSLLGVVLIARPPFLFGSAAETPVDGSSPDSALKATVAQRLSAVGVALLGVLGGTVVFTTLRAIGNRAHTLHSLTFFSSQCVIVSTVGMIITKTPIVIPTQMEFVAMLMMIGFAGYFAQILVTMGLQRETAGRAIMGNYLQIVWAMIFERMFFHPPISILSLIGTTIIVSSAIYVVLTKQTKPTAREPLAPGEDLALEEGLLENRESTEDGTDDDADADADKQKSAPAKNASGEDKPWMDGGADGRGEAASEGKEMRSM